MPQRWWMVGPDIPPAMECSQSSSSFTPGGTTGMQANNYTPKIPLVQGEKYANPQWNRCNESLSRGKCILIDVKGLISMMRWEGEEGGDEESQWWFMHEDVPWDWVSGWESTKHWAKTRGKMGEKIRWRFWWWLENLWNRSPWEAEGDWHSTIKMIQGGGAFIYGMWWWVWVFKG